METVWLCVYCETEKLWKYVNATERALTERLLYVQDSLTTTSNKEIFLQDFLVKASELLENLEETYRGIYVAESTTQ